MPGRSVSQIHSLIVHSVFIGQIVLRCYKIWRCPVVLLKLTSSVILTTGMIYLMTYRDPYISDIILNLMFFIYLKSLFAEY